MSPWRGIGWLALVALLFAACTSEPADDLTTDTAAPQTASSNEALGVDDASAASLNGTTWEFDEGFGVSEADFPKWLTFYRAGGEFLLELDSDCGRATISFIDEQGGIRLDGLEWTTSPRCWERDQFFSGRLRTEIDSRGRLLLKTSSGPGAGVLRFTHVQSTSINTEPIPDRSVGEQNAFVIGRSRWEVVGADGAAVAEDLEQIVTFSSISTNADGFSVSTGCNWQSREISWRDDGAIMVGGRPESVETGLEGEPCTDPKIGIASLFYTSRDVITAQLIDDDTLDLSGDSQNGPWSVLAVRIVREEVAARAACLDYSVASVVDKMYTGIERLPAGSERMILLDGFEVVSVEETGRDFDGDGSRDFLQLVTLRDVSSEQLVDVLHACGLSEPIDDVVRIHPNRIVAVDPWSEDSTVRVSSSDGERYHENVYSISEGTWAVLEEWSVELGSTEYLGPIIVTNKPLSSDAPGDPVNGVIRVNWGCISIDGPGGGGLVFPAGRTTWDPVNSAVVIDGVSYVDGQRIGIRRVPRPEFLEYFNPMERERCGIDNHVVADIWHIGGAS